MKMSRVISRLAPRANPARLSPRVATPACWRATIAVAPTSTRNSPGVFNFARSFHYTARRQDEVLIGGKNRLPEFSLKDKVIVVSGAGQGLGLVQAEALLEAGAIGTESTE